MDVSQQDPSVSTVILMGTCRCINFEAMYVDHILFRDFYQPCLVELYFFLDSVQYKTNYQRLFFPSCTSYLHSYILAAEFTNLLIHTCMSMMWKLNRTKNKIFRCSAFCVLC